MDIKKQPKPWHIRYRYHILAAATGLALLVYTIFVIITSGTKRPDFVTQKCPFRNWLINNILYLCIPLFWCTQKVF